MEVMRNVGSVDLEPQTQCNCREHVASTSSSPLCELQMARKPPSRAMVKTRHVSIAKILKGMPTTRLLDLLLICMKIHWSNIDFKTCKQLKCTNR